MPSMELSDDSPATELFPQFQSEIYRMISNEIEGLTEAQLDFESDRDDPNLAWFSLEATFRHRYFEYLTHLYNIQRLKRAQGLDARVEIPFEGYWALPDWDRSEP